MFSSTCPDLQVPPPLDLIAHFLQPIGGFIGHYDSLTRLIITSLDDLALPLETYYTNTLLRRDTTPTVLPGSTTYFLRDACDATHAPKPKISKCHNLDNTVL